MRVDPATPADIPALANLLTVLFTQEVEFVPDRNAQIRGLTHIVESPEIGCILVARQQGKITGMVNLLYTVSTALGERVAILEDMVVSPSARGGGIGTQLLQAAIGHARSAGCKRITLLTDQSNEIAQQFYAKQGFSVSSMVPMRLTL
jgi:GNAT superfamily N-acetyltransferase